jgi:UDP-N-acetylglucosamine--N-acetylmuramyl-(pentapeptide) pyrophosphoryl-undecaprenol N-acetylglucosamine transferase
MSKQQISADVVVAAGGTGGHLFPAQALATHLMNANVKVHFLAKGLSRNPYFKDSRFPFFDVASAGLSKNPITLMSSLWKMGYGFIESLGYLRQLRPRLVVGFGSYHTAPVLAAAKALSIPTILHEANCYPGKVNRLFSKGAEWNGVFFDRAREKLRGHVRSVTYPLRKEFEGAATIVKREALEHYGLEGEKKTIVVFGGSQGAARLNTIMHDAAPLLPADHFQVIHFTGSADAKVKQAYEKAGVLSHVASFESFMPRAYMAADLAICRSGAGTIAELMHCALPALFVPFRFAVDDHQRLNAEYIANCIGGGIVLSEDTLTATSLAASIRAVAEDKTLAALRNNLRVHRDLQTRHDFVDAVLESLNTRSR